MEYKISLIIPVYNAQKYIRSTIKSILNQSIDLKDIEIIFVDDGSLDSSVKIITSYKSEFPNIKIIKQKNQGVSHARNQGIKNAKGKYLMFLDSDDTISKNTLQNIYAFFEENEEDIDLVTYPLYYVKDKQKEPHKRNEIYQQSGIYSLGQYPYLAQTTMNVCVKNMGSKNIFFDESLDLAEDETYNTQILSKKGKIGFCKEAKYLYLKHDEAVTSYANHPFYSYKKYIKHLQRQVKLAKSCSLIRKYIQANILYSLKWHIAGDIFFPYHIEESEFNSWFKKFKSVINSIDDEILINSPFLNYSYKAYLISFKDREIKASLKDGKLIAKSEDKQLESWKKIKIGIKRMAFENDNIKILGVVESRMQYFNDVKLYLKNNETLIPIELRHSNIPSVKTNFMSKNKFFFEFSLEKPLGEYAFHFVIDGNAFDKIKLLHNEYSFVRPKYNIYSKSFGNKEITFYKERFVVKESNLINKAITRIRQDIAILQKNKKAFLMRAVSIVIRGDVELYLDKKGRLDNAYYLFLKDSKLKDSVRRYYVCYEKDFYNICKKTPREYRSNLVKFDSLLHKLLYIKAKKQYSSYINIEKNSPLGHGYKYYSDMINTKYIYIQHGIHYAHLPKDYSKETNYIDGIYVYSEAEKEIFKKIYNFKEEDISLLKMPRLDSKWEDKQRILFEPTWREYLIGKSVEGVRPLRERLFLESNYYKKIDKFLNSSRLHKILVDNDLYLDFKLPSVFKNYRKMFSSSSDRIRFLFGDEDLYGYQLYITDFSALLFDYLYKNKPVIQFIPDLEEFKSGLHSFRELEYPLDEKQVAFTSSDLITKIYSCMSN